MIANSRIVIFLYKKNYIKNIKISKKNNNFKKG